MTHESGPGSPGSDLDPFDILRYAAGVLMVVGTVVSAIIWAAGAGVQALLFFGAVWSVYGLMHSVLDDVLDPGIELIARIVQNVGLIRWPRGYSRLETLAVRGEFEAAAAGYAERAREGDATALVRRAALLAGPLHAPDQARQELEDFRQARTLEPAADVQVGVALADLFERQLDQPGLAMRELRRLLDRYPTAQGMRRIRRSLEELKEERFGSSTATPP